MSNADQVLKPGMFVKASIEGLKQDNKDLLTIPTSAVLWTGERSVVYLKTDPNKSVFEMKEVVLGKQIGEHYEVLDGLLAGNEIVTHGTFTVDAAAQLQGKKSMMNKDGGKTTTGHEEHTGMDNVKDDLKTSPSEMNKRVKVSPDFQEQLKTVFNNYINLKDALVKDNSIQVSEDARSLLDNLSQVDRKLLSDNVANNHWMSLAKDIKESANIIANATGVKEQRNHFKHLSSQLTRAVELFGVNEKVYKQFCPMADNNKGAFWLSKEEKVLNPYFGDAMLTCGSVVQTIK